jgi:HTH-type transcriptional regulator / antitoxin HigA
MAYEQIAEAFRPGVFLEEELEARGWSQLDLADILGKPASDVSLMITGKRSITPESAIALGDAFGTGPGYWMNLETAYQLSQAETKNEPVAERAAIYEHYPVRELVKRSWIRATQNVEELKSQLLGFYGKSSLTEPFQFYCAERKATSYLEENNMYQDAWLARARNLSPAVQLCGKFSQAKLRTCIAKLKKLMHEPNEIRHVPKILAEAGIRLVIVETLPKTKIDGATFWLGEKKDEPVIVMSLRYDRIDNFWFTLFHELSHVANGEGKVEPIIDENLLSDVPTDKHDFEHRADADAEKACVEPAELDSFILRTHPYYVEWKVQGFASIQNVHPGIVVGQLHHRYSRSGRGLPHSHLRKLLVKVRRIVIEAALTDGFGYTPSTGS